ncbi:alkaline phosphatase family protein [Roseibium sp.]|uniref:alkaline phosphatase family protein n=1 Tax=Roseibium sp. TaxID=1936156 RepID=UPI003BABFE23
MKNAFVTLAFATTLSVCGTSTMAQDKPKLILQITVDQLRGDLPGRYYDRLGEGGFKYLLDQGVHYIDAHHGHANLETIVGHATLATGAHPSVHGMVGNLWFDREKGHVVYNIEDPDYSLLSEGAGINSETELDGTQAAATSDGRSPRALMATTFADELSSYTAGKAKVFGVSVKDRGAVPLAGRAGKAFWFSKANAQFVTSDYYYREYPEWVKEWNIKNEPFIYTGKSWTLLHPRETYLFADRDDQPWETDVAGYGRTFPHEFGWFEDPYYTTFLTISPVGDRLTTDFAKALIDAEGLGQDDITDFLSVSYSAMDYIGHVFGPSSLESEDGLLQLDRTLADLLAYVDQKIGLNNTLIVLSADHGAPEAPGYLESIGSESGIIRVDTWDTEPAISRLKETFGIDGPLIGSYSHPYLYLANDLLSDPSIDLDALETAVANEVAAFDGIAMAVTAKDVERGTLPDTLPARAVRNNHHPLRSGNIMLVNDPGYFIADLDGLTITVTHGTPWNYDTFVPIIFAGFGLEPQKVTRRVQTIDVARTLAAVAGTVPPSGASGNVLPEVLGNSR